MTEQFDLNFRIYRLLQSEPFFAVISRTVEKIRSTEVPTAGVRLNPDTSYFELIYNPDFLGKLTEDQCRDVILHEFLSLDS